MRTSRWRTACAAAALMTAGLYGLDQITKRIVETTMVEGESHQVIGTWVRWTFYRNPGAAFSVGEQMTWLFTLMMVVVGGYVIFLLTRARSAAWLFALCGLLAGILGNLTDRLLRPPGFGVGHVVDFIHVRHFAIFNVADSCICVSIGAINGALIAREPSLVVVDRLHELWRTVAESRDVYGDTAVRTVRRALSTRTHVYSSQRLKQRLHDELGDITFAQLPTRFQVCAASIERAAEHWFDSGPVVEAVVASAAVPGLLPPALVDGEHYLDGGIVNSVPLGRAVELGATRVFVLQVGRIDRPLTPPRRPWEVARVSFEIARRHRFVREMSQLPDSVECHVLPAGGTSARDDSLWAHRDFTGIQRRIDTTYAASSAYLEEHL